jgi:CotS family spore coat protein
LYDYGLSTLEQYQLTAKSTSRARGALLCRTEQGLLILKEFQGSEKKLKKQQELLLTVETAGFSVDSYLENQEGELVSRDRDGIPYTLQHWYEGRECDPRSREDILKSVGVLAALHKAMVLTLVEDYMEPSLGDEFQRHNREIRSIRKFIRRKGPSGTFEKAYLDSVEWYLGKGEEALQMLRDSAYDDLRRESRGKGCVCHGEYNQHNVLILKSSAAVTNFRHWGFDIQISDLYHFMRKILEKYNWDLSLGREMLNAYHREKPITREEWEYLKICFAYPEKYWKLANYYFSHNKVWISEKNTEKLNDLIRQQERWVQFIGKCFAKYPF